MILRLFFHYCSNGADPVVRESFVFVPRRIRHAEKQTIYRREESDTSKPMGMSFKVIFHPNSGDGIFIMYRRTC
jgi:hypothetical protein